MTASELRRLIAASATPGPEECTDENRHGGLGGHNPDRCPWLAGMRAYETIGSVMVQHADAFVRLLEACEARRNIECSPSCNGRSHSPACEIRLSLVETLVDEAVKAVRAVRSAP